MSSDQHLAMALHLRRKAHHAGSDTAAQTAMRERARTFLAYARAARYGDWPSSAVAPFLILTENESISAWAEPATRQRVFFPRLTATELAELRRRAKESSAYFRNAFAHLKPIR